MLDYDLGIPVFIIFQQFLLFLFSQCQRLIRVRDSDSPKLPNGQTLRSVCSWKSTRSWDSAQIKLPIGLETEIEAVQTMTRKERTLPGIASMRIRMWWISEYPIHPGVVKHTILPFLNPAYLDLHQNFRYPVSHIESMD
jgi:hypothetical protein